MFADPRVAAVSPYFKRSMMLTLAIQNNAKQ